LARGRRAKDMVMHATPGLVRHGQCGSELGRAVGLRRRRRYRSRSGGRRSRWNRWSGGGTSHMVMLTTPLLLRD
jgi:hypothetical protein